MGRSSWIIQVGQLVTRLLVRGEQEGLTGKEMEAEVGVMCAKECKWPLEGGKALEWTLPRTY